MGKFIELKFGQSMGEVQSEIVPVEAVKDAYIVLPEKRNIEISFEHSGRTYKRTEYYRDETECSRRWMEIRQTLGLGLYSVNYTPLPDDANYCADYIKELDKIEELLKKDRERKPQHTA